MYEVRVTGHECEDPQDQPKIRIIKMFRMVTGHGLKDSKDAVENMIGSKFQWNRDLNNHEVLKFQRKPFVMNANTFIRAKQIEIEFKHGGFTVEVVKTNGQGSEAS